MVRTRHLEEDEDVYIESEIIMTTVRLLAPFVSVYGFYLAFHGANAPGGAFQGGAVLAATVIMVGFAYGIAHTREWILNDVLTGLMGFGAVFLGALGFSSMFLGGSFLDYRVFHFLGFKKAVKYGVEAMEIGGIFPIVAGALIGLFFVTAAGTSEGKLWRGVEK